MSLSTREALTTLRHLASGGMGTVSVAVRREGGFERLYAVKRLHKHLADEEGFRSMFVDEARIAGYIRHAHVVSVLDVGEDADGPYLVMDYVPGTSVVELLKRFRGTLPIQIALRIVRQAALGLHAAHELHDHDGQPLEVVHRDVSPANLLIGFDGVVRVTDFGVARALGRSTQTTAGVLKGKFGYMAPEQLRFGTVDRRSDLFSLGVVLYELVAGRRMPGRKHAEAAYQSMEDAPPDLGEARDDVPPSLVDLNLRMLCANAEARPATGLVVAGALDEILEELVLEEGECSLPEFIESALHGDRIAHDAEIARSLNALDAPDTEKRPETRPMDLESRPRRSIMLLAAGALMIGAGAFVWLGLDGADEVPRPAADVVVDQAPLPAPVDWGEQAPTAPEGSTAEPVRVVPAAEPVRVDPTTEPIAVVEPDSQDVEVAPSAQMTTMTTMTTMRRTMRPRPRPADVAAPRMGLGVPVETDWGGR